MCRTSKVIIRFYSNKDNIVHILIRKLIKASDIYKIKTI